jgi:hypothetical protein
MPDRIIVSAPGPQGPAGSGGGGSISDGDKGDITVSGVGTVWTVDAGAIDTTKLGGDITTAGKALLDDADAAAQRTTLGLQSAATQPATNFATSNHNHVAADITSQPASSLVARPEATGGACSAVTLGTGLRFNGSTLETTNLAGSTTNMIAGTGLTGGGSLAADRTFNVAYGTSAGTACEGDDARLSDARTPTAHTHDAADINAGTLGIARIPTGTSSNTVCVGDDARLSDARTPTAHTHALSDIQQGGALTGEVLKWNGSAWAPGTDNTSGGGGGAPTSAQYFTLTADATLSDERVLTFGTGLTATDGGAGAQYDVEVDYGTTAATACEGNDSRLSDARAPTAHTHDFVDSYVGHIEAPAVGTYYIDTYAAGSRTVTGIHIVAGSGTVDWTLRRVVSGLGSDIYTADGQGSTQSNITSGLSNTALSAGNQLELQIDATSSGADVRFTIVYSRTTGAIT